MLRFALRWRCAILLSAAAIPGACSVADSLYVDAGAIQASSFSPVAPTLCRSSLGSYALPKSYLRVRIVQDGNGPLQLDEPTAVVRADKSLTFCLDHIADPLADDEIRIIKSSGQLDKSYLADEAKKEGLVGSQLPANETEYGSQLLQWVVSNTVDQSEYIARVLVRTAFIAISGNPNFTPLGRTGQEPAAAKTTVALFEYDPFHPEQSALHNKRLRDLGYCLVLDNVTFDRRRMTVEQYCAAPRYEVFPYDDAYGVYIAGPPPRVSGIAYRPRITYPISVYKSEKPNGRGRWRLHQQFHVPFENISPIVSIGLTRSMFAARRIALKFHMGALEAMCLVKTSELESAVAVPYEIAKSIVALPTEIFEVKIGNISDNIELLEAERRVVAAQAEYLDFLASATKTELATPRPKKEAVGLPTIPNPIATTVPPSAVANLENLQSSVLAQICRNAPSVIVPAARTKGGPP